MEKARCKFSSWGEFDHCELPPKLTLNLEREYAKISVNRISCDKIYA
ncbi:hypothetical protein [Porcincola intestinalis]|nr:hypothetical protein [Porcincola intestinalis]